MVSRDTGLPNFFVVGAAKAGTTSIYHHIKMHPQIFVPEEKEPSFFATPAPPGVKPFHARCPTFDEYKKMYQGSVGFTAVGDLSTPYLWDENAPRRIHEACPNAKIIIMLRDPIARAYSFYLMNLLTELDTTPTFQEALRRDAARDKSTWFTCFQYVGAGLYHDQVRRYLDLFGSERVLVRLFDELKENPHDLYAAIAAHLDIDAEPFHAIEVDQAHNYYRMPRFRVAYRIAGALGLRTKLLPPSVRRWLNHNPLLFDRKKPTMDDASRQYLKGIFEPDVARLEALLGRTFPELRKSWG
jgi:Sulfotransferase family